MQVQCRIALEGFIFGKVKVKVTGLAVCLFLYSSQVFGPISIKLGGWMQVDQKIVFEGFIFAKVKVKVTGVKWSNNGLISIKLGGWMQGWVTGSKVKVIFGKVKVKVTGVKGQIMVRSPSNLVGGCREGSRGQK